MTLCSPGGGPAVGHLDTYGEEECGIVVPDD
jgi:hypothetical protein